MSNEDDELHGSGIILVYLVMALLGAGVGSLITLVITSGLGGACQ